MNTASLLVFFFCKIPFLFACFMCALDPELELVLGKQLSLSEKVQQLLISFHSLQLVISDQYIISFFLLPSFVFILCLFTNIFMS